MNFPDNIRYAKSHEWVRLEEGNVGVVGISDFAQSELGDIVFVDVTAAPGDVIGQDGTYGSIEAVKTVSDLYMPVEGELLEVNPQITDKPELINSDPYGEGWMVKIRVANPSALDGLMDAAAHRTMVGHG